jgi:hypothetical protein
MAVQQPDTQCSRVYGVVPEYIGVAIAVKVRNLRTSLRACKHEHNQEAKHESTNLSFLISSSVKGFHFRYSLNCAFLMPYFA